MKMLQSLLLLPFLLLLLPACTKRDPGPGISTPTEDFARHYLFQTGSWWAYRDSASGHMDTMRIDTAWTWEGTLTNFGGDKRYRQKGASMFYSHTSMPTMRVSGMRLYTATPYICWRSDNAGHSFYMGYGLEKGTGGVRGPGSSGWNPDENIYFRDTLASVTVGNTVIDNIHVFDLDSAKWSAQSFPVHSRVWWAKDIGLVKYQTNQGHTFILENWNAIPLWPLP